MFSRNSLSIRRDFAIHFVRILVAPTAANQINLNFNSIGLLIIVSRLQLSRNRLCLELTFKIWHLSKRFNNEIPKINSRGFCRYIQLNMNMLFCDFGGAIGRL